MSAHECSECGQPLTERDIKTQTPEQTFCGTWFDHPPTPYDGCQKNLTVLEPSEALLAQHKAMANGGTQ